MIAALLFTQKFIHWLEKNSMPCFYKKFLGIECPGCGMQRSFIELLKGNFVESFKLYPALTTTIALILLLILHIIFKFRNGAKYLLIIFIVNTIILLSNYILKLTI
jgi:hypothetical protein